MILIIVLIALSLLMSFFFSGSETAVISANRFGLRQRESEGDVRAGKTLALLSDSSRLMSVVLIGTNLGNVLAVLFFKLLLERTAEERAWAVPEGSVWGLRWEEWIVLALLTPVIVVFAEILPKALFRARADNLIVRIQPVLALSRAILTPVIFVLDGIVRAILAPFNAPLTAHGTHGPRLTRHDLIMILGGGRMGNGHGEDARSGRDEEADPAIGASEVESSIAAEPNHTPAQDQAAAIREPDQSRLIQNIIGLEQTQAREIMKPLVELEAVHLGHTSIDSFLDRARRCGYSRFPAYTTRIVDLIGYIDVYDIIRNVSENQNLEDFLRPAYFVPETKRVDDLLQEMLERRLNSAIVVDEYGGCSGWITLEDIIEEIVGELEDELDQPVISILEQSDGSYLIEGRSDLEDVDEVLGVELEDFDCDTFGGYLMKTMGRIPKAGDEAAIGDWRVRIEQMDGMRIATARVWRPDPST